VENGRRLPHTHSLYYGYRWFKKRGCLDRKEQSEISKNDDPDLPSNGAFAWRTVCANPVDHRK
jgi:hypothetical protein